MLEHTIKLTAYEKCNANKWYWNTKCTIHKNKREIKDQHIAAQNDFNMIWIALDANDSNEMEMTIVNDQCIRYFLFLSSINCASQNIPEKSFFDEKWIYISLLVNVN